MNSNEVIVEFVKNVAIGTARIAGFVAGVALAINVAIWFGMDPNAAVPTVMIGILVVMFVWFGLSSAWDRAKAKVEYKQKWGYDL